MLVVTRKLGEQIQIRDDVTVTVTRIGLDRVKLGISAPSGVTVMRAELIDERQPEPGDWNESSAARFTPNPAQR